MGKKSNSRRAYQRRQDKKNRREKEAKKGFFPFLSKIASFIFSTVFLAGKGFFIFLSAVSSFILSAAKAVGKWMKKKREEKKEKKKREEEKMEKEDIFKSLGIEKAGPMATIWVYSIKLLLIIFFFASIYLAYQSIVKVDWKEGLIAASLFLVFYFVFLKRLKKYHTEERMVLEFLGKFWKVAGPGLVWIPPLVGEKTKGPISIWKTDVSLRPKKDDPEMDFFNGGKATLADPVIWVKLRGKNEKERKKNVLRATYSAGSWVELIKKAAFSELKDLLMATTVERIFQEKHGTWVDFLPETRKEIEELGFNFLYITISDFQWDKETTEALENVFRARKKVEVAELEAQAAKFEADKKAALSGELLKKIEEMLSSTYENEEERRKVAQEVFEYLLASSSGQLVKIQTENGSGGTDSTIANLVAIVESVKNQIGKK